MPDKINMLNNITIAAALMEISKAIDEVNESGAGGYYDGDEMWHGDIESTLRDLSVRLENRARAIIGEDTNPETARAMTMLQNVLSGIVDDSKYEMSHYENRSVYLTMLDNPTWGYELVFYVKDLNACKVEHIKHFIHTKIDFMKAVDGELDTNPTTSNDEYSWLFDPLDYANP